MAMMSRFVIRKIVKRRLYICQVLKKVLSTTSVWTEFLAWLLVGDMARLRTCQASTNSRSAWDVSVR